MLSLRFILSIRSLLLWARIPILNHISIAHMLPFRAQPQFLLLIILFLVNIAHVHCMVTNCTVTADCPTNSFCGVRGFCVCEPGFILNCSTSALTLTGIPITAAISPVETYYVIEPQVLYEFLKFSVQITTT